MPQSNVFTNANQFQMGSYDAAGNQTAVGSYALNYDAENRQIKAQDWSTLSNGSTLYQYDGNGQRVQKAMDIGATIYVYDAFGKLTSEYTNFPAGAPPCATCYLSKDHLGKAVGAALGWWSIGHWTQAIFVAILAPAWLSLEWWYFVGENGAAAPALVFLFMIATVYLGGRQWEEAIPLRQALTWIGATTILPLGIALSFGSRTHSVVSPWASAAAWILSVLLPLAISFFLRTSAAWTIAAILWAVAIAQFVHGGIAGYAWDAIGAIGLALWGMREGRSERVNLGIAGFALTVAIFYFSSVMDKLGRSASLVGLGILLLGGGWALERLRRAMVERTRAATL